METNLARLCRLCLETSDDIVNIFESFQGSTIASILTQHFWFQVIINANPTLRIAFFYLFLLWMLTFPFPLCRQPKVMAFRRAYAKYVGSTRKRFTISTNGSSGVRKNVAVLLALERIYIRMQWNRNELIVQRSSLIWVLSNAKKQSRRHKWFSCK